MTNKNKRKRYWWMKTTEQFINGAEVSYLMTQGATGFKALLLFQKILIKMANNNGRLSTKIGDAEVPYSPELIHNDFGGFGVTTIKKSLKLLETCGLLRLENDIYYIANFNDFIGSETGSAFDMRELREAERKLAETVIQEKLETATEQQRLSAHRMTKNLYDIGLINNMSDPEPYETCLNGLLGLIIEYGERYVDYGIDHALNYATIRNAEKRITNFRFNITTNLSQVQFLLRSVQKQCEKMRVADIKRGEY